MDTTRRLADQPGIGHNRWHPDIPAIASVAPGEELTLELVDGLDGQITPESRHEDLLRTKPLAHPLTGPIAVEGAEPGDVLVVEILAYETADFGWTAIWPGGSTLLGDLFERPFLARWQLADGLARSEELPGVAIPEATFAGVIGVAPSRELFERMRRREQELADAGARVRLPDASTAVPREADDGLKTIPPRETGGNLDVRGLVAGSRLFLPVHVPGALLSAGDLHFAQGDGEVCSTAIETSGAVTVRLDVRKDGWGPEAPAYESPAGRPGGRSFATTGLPLAADGSNADMDLTLAARNALLAMLDFLAHERGYTREQAYVLASVAVDLRISEVVDIPNPVVSAVLPLEVFEDEHGES